MDINILRKADADHRKLSELAYVAMKTNGSLAEDTQEETFLIKMDERISKESYDWIFIAENDGKLVGWLAFYELTDSKIAQIWNWHPLILPEEDGKEAANELIQAACSHLREIGLEKVTIDFQLNTRTQSYFTRYLGWYSQAGIHEVIEERHFKKNVMDEDLEIQIPDDYSIGRISETDLDDLFECWESIFSSSDDQFILSLDAEGRRDFFLESWSRSKPLIDEASLTLYHEGRLIGFSRVLPIYEPTDGYLAPIGILPEYRRKGLAQGLLKLSMLKLKALNYQTMSCYVSIRNTAAIALYEQLGFESKHRIGSIYVEIV